jgi:hypothetical protein
MDDHQVLARPPWLGPITVLTSINTISISILACTLLSTSPSASRLWSILQPSIQAFASALHRSRPIAHGLLLDLLHYHRPSHSTPITRSIRDMLHTLTPQLVSSIYNENSDHLIDNHAHHSNMGTYQLRVHIFQMLRHIISMKKTRNSKLFKILRRRYIYWHLHTNWVAAILWVITTLVLMRCQRIMYNKLQVLISI